ncbi:hypothetical protein NMG60_11021352 [Bertholletia excelsa]
MENYSYTASYPESGDSSPRSREIDFENTPWEEQPKVKFMYSYGGKIHPRPHDNQLSYIGGETKILSVDRNIKFTAFIAKLSALCEADICFKYQLPGEDLDALISVTNDDDLEHMMHEYDRLSRASKPPRLRLFLFPVTQSTAASSVGSFGSGEGKSDRDRFVDALNSAPSQPSPPQSTVAPPSNADFLFGLEKGAPPPPAVATKLQDQAPELEIPAPPHDERVVVGADPIQRQIQDFQRLHIGGHDQAIYRRKSDDNLVGGFSGGDYYVQKLPEKMTPTTLPAAVSASPAYWPEKHVPGGVYPASTPPPEQPVYMIPAHTGMYHAPVVRPVTGPAGQGYYAVQRMSHEVYRDQPPVYNVVPPAPAATAVAPPTLPPQPPQKVTGYSEGLGMVRQTTAGGVAMVDTGYQQMAYDTGAGRQMYYNTPGGVMAPSPYQAMAVSGGDMRAAGALNQEGKVVVKAPQAPV